MTFSVNKSGVLKAISSVSISIGGVWKTVSRIQIYKGGALHYVYGTTPPPPPGPPPPPPPPPSPPVVLSVSISPPETNKLGRNVTTVTTAGVAASSSNGTGPFTCSWALSTWTAGPLPTADFPTSATTTFTQTGMAGDDVREADFTVTMVDSLGNTGSASIHVTFYTSTNPLILDGR